MSERVAFLGLGIMGSRMAANLAKSGYELSVWNRTRATAEQFAAEHGATVAPTPAQAAKDCGLVFTMVVDGPQVQEVLLGEDGAAHGAPAGALCVDCSTIGPAATREIGDALAQRGLTLIDAPVTGSSPKAQDGTLTFMVGGSSQDFKRIRPLLDVMGEVIVHAGPQGHGQMVKLINNSVAASNLAVLGQALIVGHQAGIDLDALVQVMGAGAGGSVMLTLKAGPMRTHDYTTLFKLEHMLKDVSLCLNEGQRLGVPFPSAASTREVLVAAMGLGHADDDFAAMIEPLEGAAGCKLTDA
jgi:3-hydroxyisobutyrate dehydrogenase-like beta-hydroxyacid dehydrogenase